MDLRLLPGLTRDRATLVAGALLVIEGVAWFLANLQQAAGSAWLVVLGSDASVLVYLELLGANNGLWAPVGPVVVGGLGAVVVGLGVMTGRRWAWWRAVIVVSAWTAWLLLDRLLVNTALAVVEFRGGVASAVPAAALVLVVVAYNAAILALLLSPGVRAACGAPRGLSGNRVRQAPPPAGAVP